MALLEWTYYGNTLYAWLLALLVCGAALSSLQIAKRVLIRQLTALAARTDNEVDDLAVAVLARSRSFFLVALSILVATRFLYLPEGAAGVVRAGVITALMLQIALWGSATIAILLNRFLEKRLEEDPATATTVKFLGFISHFGLWAVVVLLTLRNAFHLDITALVAGLGVGGIAIALAVQNILGDLFASLSIVLDRPFVIGDFIIVENHMGTVEHVGLKTTRVRSLSGEQIIFANADLLQSRVRNYKRMYERRVVFSIGLTRQTPYEKLAEIPALMREIVEAREKTRFDRAHFKAFGDFALEFEIVYYVLDSDYNLYMDIQQAINLELFRRFQELGVEFAYPTRTLHVRQVAPAAVPVPAGSGD